MCNIGEQADLSAKKGSAEEYESILNCNYS